MEMSSKPQRASPSPHRRSDGRALIPALVKFVTGSVDPVQFLDHLYHMSQMAGMTVFHSLVSLSAVGVAGCKMAGDVSCRRSEMPLKSQQDSGMTYLTYKFGENVHDQVIVDGTADHVRLDGDEVH